MYSLQQNTNQNMEYLPPRWSLDSKDSSGTDIPFKVTIDVMIVTAQNFMRSNIRVLRLYLAVKMPCYKSMGAQVAETKTFPINQ
jgi:hypothetical protein